MGQTIKLAIADDHLLFRKGVISILNAFPDIELIAEASNGGELIEKIERAKQLPDVCLLDLRMPILDGYHTLPVLRSRWDISVLVLSMHDHDFSVIQMLELGAKGFINKDCTPDMLHAAIKSVHNRLLSFRTKPRLAEKIPRQNEPAYRKGDHLHPLLLQRTYLRRYC